LLIPNKARRSLWRHTPGTEKGRTGRCLQKSWAVVLLLLVLFGAVFQTQSQGSSPGEYQLKAAFLFNFAKFVEWPQSSFANPRSPFEICILGNDPFGPAIDDVLRGKAIGEHPVVVARPKEVADARHCQILFVSSSEQKRLPAILAALKGTNALVVGETDGFAVSGGIIQFTLEEERVRFMINTDAAERAGLQISSKLLALARIVRDAPGNAKG
jgi:hypothetical protein